MSSRISQEGGGVHPFDLNHTCSCPTLLQLIETVQQNFLAAPHLLLDASLLAGQAESAQYDDPSALCINICWHKHNYGQTHLSEMATESGSVGGIMKQTAGAVILRPAVSLTSHLVPLFWSRVYLSPRTICPCTRSNVHSVICCWTAYTVQTHKSSYTII